MSTNILGIPLHDGCKPIHFLGGSMMQNRFAVPAWSHLAELRPPARIIELGTHDGGFSACLALLCLNLGIPFYTYEKGAHFAPKASPALFSILVRDVFDAATIEEIKPLIQAPGVTWLLCDNGAKEREWTIYSPFLKAGDIIGAHDYLVKDDYWICSEFNPANVNMEGLRKVTFPDFDIAGWYVSEKL